MNWLESFINPLEDTFVRKLTVFGACLGITLLLFSLILDIYFLNATFSFSGIYQAFSANPILWIVSTSPFFLGFIFHSLSKMIHHREKELANKMEKEHQEALIINKKINNLVNGIFTFEQDKETSEISKNLETLRIRLHEQQQSEQKRKWVTEGLANFGEVLRQQNSIEDLSYHFLHSLVKYLKFSLGGVFLVTKNDQQETTLELEACYAYDRKKFLKKSLESGEGLVGQCFLERRSILLYEIPSEYLLIKSGLGEANPNCIVLFPLLTQESIEGVIELAGFRRLQEFEMDFLSKVCESFASVLRNAALAENTKRLLEITQQQAESLRLKEDEMKQNMKDLEETMLDLLKTKQHDVA